MGSVGCFGQIENIRRQSLHNSLSGKNVIMEDVMNKIIRFNDSEKLFRCPICKRKLKMVGNSLLCSNKHCFDISKLGYVNFALNQKQSKHYSRTSFESRMDILEKGYYSHILTEITHILSKLENITTILDVGCGEGYYSRKIKELFQADIVAFDISKDAISLASKRDGSKSIKWFVGDLENMPIRDHSVDCILDIFTPANYLEFNRVLTDSGYIVKVIPGNKHLMEFRNIAKEHLKNQEYSNENVINLFKKQYSVIYQKRVSESYEMPLEDIKIFADMTPLLFHVDKTEIDFKKLKTLTIDAEIFVGSL